MKRKAEIPPEQQLEMAVDWAKPDKDAPWGGYIDVRMTPELKQAYEGWLSIEGAYFWDQLLELMVAGFKFGVMADNENGCLVTSLLGCGMRGNPNKFCLTARSGKLENATSLLVFKHTVVLAGDWGHYSPNQKVQFSWG